ncbi:MULTISPECIES: hypothetical protein [Micromonospora]|uniref:hypothetical protein n=1 Tax=Micromonospora TaxID=1873 RepID=UPI000A05C9A9|nr:hypothetical protein [Micromonospora globosa]
MTEWLARRHRAQADRDLMSPRTIARSLEALPQLLGGAHVPEQPAWTCPACGGAAWPCSPARTILAEAYGPDRADLAIYVGQLLFAAAAKLTATPAHELNERFISWTQ